MIILQGPINLGVGAQGENVNHEIVKTRRRSNASLSTIYDSRKNLQIDFGALKEKIAHEFY